MIIRFAIDPSVLTYGKYSADSYERLIHDWLDQRIGVLVNVHGDDGGAIEMAIQRIKDQAASKLWKETYREADTDGLIVRLMAANEDVSEYSRDLIEKMAGQIDVLVINPGAEKQYGGNIINQRPGSTILQYPNTQIELVTADRFDQSDSVRRVENLRTIGDIPEATPIQEIWEDHYMTMFMVSKEIFIVDRYALSELSKGGLGRFIEMAKAHIRGGKPKEKQVVIYTQQPLTNENRQPYPNQAAAVKAAVDKVKEWLSDHDAQPNPFGKINIYFVPPRGFARNYQDRYIRFGKIGSVGGGHGLAHFEGAQYKTDIARGISWKRGAKESLVVESQLTAIASPSHPLEL